MDESFDLVAHAWKAFVERNKFLSGVFQVLVPPPSGVAWDSHSRHVPSSGIKAWW